MIVMAWWSLSVFGAEAEATGPEYSARLAEIDAAEARADQTEDEYQTHTRRVDAMMSLNGRTY